MMEENKQGILLESGTNEIEIMKFTIGGNLFGINVAKVREIMICAPVKPMPHAHPAVEGIFKPRDVVLTVVDLPRYLGDEGEKTPKDIFIVTNFNKMHIAFRVHTVDRISRISWTDIQKPDKAVSGGAESVATALPSATASWSPFWTLSGSWRRSPRRLPSRSPRWRTWAPGTATNGPSGWRRIPPC